MGFPQFVAPGQEGYGTFADDDAGAGQRRYFEGQCGGGVGDAVCGVGGDLKGPSGGG